MKRSRLIILIIVIILIFTAMILWYKNTKSNEVTDDSYSKEKINLLNIKADNLFGSGKCTNEKCNMVTDDYNKQECELCSKEFTGSSSYSICYRCSQNLNRCNICGKKR